MTENVHSTEVRADPSTPETGQLWRWHCTCGASGPIANTDREAVERGAETHMRRAGPPLKKRPPGRPRRRADTA